MQVGLFSRGRPCADSTFRSMRRLLSEGDAWVLYAPEWLSGHEALFIELSEQTLWQEQRRQMYDREVTVPRLVGTPLAGSSSAEHLATLAQLLSRRFDRALTHISLCCYRDGQDSVAMHGDKLGALVGDSIVAILAVGAPRHFVLREKSPRSDEARRKWSVNSGLGDLLVMGGSCQRELEHGIPKVARADARISVMFREPSAFSPRYVRRSVPAALNEEEPRAARIWPFRS